MILITGSSGFIGRHLVKEFADRDVFCATEANMNLRNPQMIDEVIAEVQPEVVIHLAAKTEVAWSFDDYLDVSQVNYLGTVALAEANRRLNPNLRLFVMASTMETYGHQLESEPFTEETPQYPMAPYAVAKVACEKYLDYMDYAYGFPYTILRQTNAYGRHDNDFFVVERILTQMLKGDGVRLGDPDPWRNFLHISDLVALYRAVVDQRPVGETFVTGPDNALSIGDLAEQCRVVTGYDGDIEWHTIPKRPGEIYFLSSNPVKAERELGWTPKVELLDGLSRTADLWRS
jgi:nucleoside-diphosphate-sugar epimerase